MEAEEALSSTPQSSVVSSVVVVESKRVERPAETSGEGKGAGLGRPGMQTRVGGSFGSRANVT